MGGEEVWLWGTIHEWAAQRNRSIRVRKRQGQASNVDVVDLTELAKRLDTDDRTIQNWHRVGFLPTADYVFETTEAWLWETIERWTQGGRRPIAQPDESEPRRPRLTVRVNSTPPAARNVTPVRGRAIDPIGDLERIQQYFSDMASSLRAPASRV